MIRRLIGDTAHLQEKGPEAPALFVARINGAEVAAGRADP